MEPPSDTTAIKPSPRSSAGCTVDLTLRRIVQAAAILVLISATVNISGLLVGMTNLSRNTIGGATQLPLLSCVGFCFASLSLLAVAVHKTTSQEYTRFARVLSIAVMLIGIGDTANTVMQERLAFVLFGAGALCLNAERARVRNLSQISAVLIGLPAILIINIHIYGLDPTFYGYPHDLPTGAYLNLFCLAVGLFLARPQSGAASIFLSPNAAGTAARRLVMPSLLIVPVLGTFMSVKNYQSDLALLIAVFTFVMPLVVWVIALGLKRERDLSERKFQAIFNQTFEFIGLLSIDGILLEANKAALDALGLTAGDVIGKPFWETPWWSHSQAAQNQLKFAIAGAARGKTAHFETEHMALDRTITVDFSLKPFRDERGKVVMIVPEGRDISNYKHLENELRNYVRSLDARDRLINEAANCETVEQLSQLSLLIIEDLTGSKFGYIGFLNSQGMLDNLALSDYAWDVCKVAGFQPFTLIKELPIRGVDRAVILEGRSRIINGAQAIQAHRDYFGLPQGHPELSAFMGVPLLEGEKAIGLIALANKDGGYSPVDQEYVERLAPVIVVSVRRKQAALAIKKLNAELLLSNKELSEARDRSNQASKLKSEFLANMSHEIRTPLNGIIGMIELLKRKDLNPEYYNYLNNISESGDSLLTVINDILDFSKIEAGRLALDKVPFELVKLIESTAESLITSAQKKGLSLITFIDPHAPTSLLGDPVRLRQILVNFIGNAIKFSDTGEVLVSASVAADEASAASLVFSVTDNGVGISEEQMARIFEPFVQADGSITRKAGGTGLGLSICRRLAELMGGQISVASLPGLGSTFSFKVSLDKPSRQESVQQMPHNLSGLHILIADDAPLSLRTLNDYLLSWGMRTCQATSVDQALELLRAAAPADPFQIVIIDLLLADKRGIGLCKAIKNDPVLQSTHIVLTISHDDSPLIEDALACGFSTVLVKPIRQSQLLDCLCQVMQGSSIVYRHQAGKEAQHKRLALPEKSIPSRPELILVAEDNRINQDVAVALLRDLGFEVHVAADGRAALEALSLETYSLVLMDIQMPQLDGFETTKIIRQAEVLTRQHLPLIAMTANAMEGCREECLEAGLDDYISKPINPSRLAAVIEKWLPVSVSEPDLIHQQMSQSGTVMNQAIISMVNHEKAPVDLQAIAEFYHPENTRKILLLFLDTAPCRLDELKNSFHTRAASILQGSAHNLKGSCKTVFAANMASLCQEIDQAASRQDWTTLAQLIEQLESEFAQVQLFLKDRV